MKNNASCKILAIDLAHSASVLMVIIVHILWIYGNMDTQANTWLGKTIHFIGKGTPLFLIVMGVSFTLSRNQSIKLTIKRALYVLVMGCFMNLPGFVIPTVLGIIPNKFIEACGWTPPVTTANLFYMLSTGDILQLAGISLLFMGLINILSKNKYLPLGIVVLIIVLTKVVHGFQLRISVVDYVLDMPWGVGWNIYFAVFPWSLLILIGIFFGRLHKEGNKNPSYLFSRMGIGGILLMLLGGHLCYINFEYNLGDYFHLGPGGGFYFTGFNLVLLWLAHISVSKKKPNCVFQFLFYCNKQMNTIYVIQ